MCPFTYKKYKKWLKKETNLWQDRESTARLEERRALKGNLLKGRNLLKSENSVGKLERKAI